MSSSSVTDITKVVAPIAFNALIAAAEKLAGAANAAFALKNMLLKVVADISGRTAMNDPVDSSALFNSLSAAGNNLWQNNFGYFYNGQTSRCILPDGIHTAKALNSGTDLLIHDESQGQVPNVQGYLTSLFKNTPLSDPSTIALVKNLTDIITARWTEESLDWQPLTKTYAGFTDQNSNNIQIDALMFTACAGDANGALAGLAFYMFTYYKVPSA